MDPNQQEILKKEFPYLLGNQAKPKPQDGFQQAAKESSQAFTSYKKAVLLKGKLQAKVALIEQ
eukprot:13684065-Heterocapsa_arctica.AAC.1